MMAVALLLKGGHTECVRIRRKKGGDETVFPESREGLVVCLCTQERMDDKEAENACLARN
jgi:hypothetical protein